MDRLWKRLWSLSYPVIIGGLSQSIVNTVDMAMVGRLGRDALSSVGISAATIWIITGSLGSVQIATQALTSRRMAMGEREAFNILSSSIVLAILMALPVALVGLVSSGHILSLLTKDRGIVHRARPYLDYRFIGLLFVMPAISLKGFFNGIGETRTYMKAALIVNLANIILDYLLIFGKLSMPALGLKGAAIASVTSFSTGLIYLYAKASSKGFSLRLSDVEGKTIVRLLRLTTPPAIQVIATSGGLWVFLRMADSLGHDALALTTILLQIMSITLLFGVGIGVASVTLMGVEMGKGREEMAMEIGWRGLKMGAYILGGAGVLFILFPSGLIRLFTDDTALINTGKGILPLLGAVQFLWAMGITLSHTLQGMGDGVSVMVIELVIHWLIFLPIAYILAFKLDLEIFGLWTGFAIYIMILGLSMAWRFKHGRWREKVI